MPVLQVGSLHPLIQGKGEWHSLCLQVISMTFPASARCCHSLASDIPHLFSHLRFVYNVYISYLIIM